MPCIFESAQSRMGPDALEQSSKAGIGKTIFCKGPGSKYFRFCKPYGLYHNYSTLPLWHESSHKQHIDEQRYLSSNKTLFTKRGCGPDLAPGSGVPNPWTSNHLFPHFSSCFQLWTKWQPGSCLGTQFFARDHQRSGETHERNLLHFFIKQQLLWIPNWKLSHMNWGCCNSFPVVLLAVPLSRLFWAT